MKYDFTTIMDRRGMDAIAVDNIPYSDVQVKEGFSVIPANVNDPTLTNVFSNVRGYYFSLVNRLR